MAVSWEFTQSGCLVGVLVKLNSQPRVAVSWEFTQSGRLVGVHPEWPSRGSSPRVAVSWEFTQSGRLVGVHPEWPSRGSSCYVELSTQSGRLVGVLGKLPLRSAKGILIHIHSYSHSLLSRPHTNMVLAQLYTATYQFFKQDSLPHSPVHDY